jgi:hypothetical protein
MTQFIAPAVVLSVFERTKKKHHHFSQEDMSSSSFPVTCFVGK